MRNKRCCLSGNERRATDVSDVLLCLNIIMTRLYLNVIILNVPQFLLGRHAGGEHAVADTQIFKFCDTANTINTAKGRKVPDFFHFVGGISPWMVLVRTHRMRHLRTGGVYG